MSKKTVTAMAVHKTGVDRTSAWDFAGNMKRLATESAGEMYACSRGSEFAFPHHQVGEDGKIGPANMAALDLAMKSLNAGEVQLSEKERLQVYLHLAAHYEEAEMKPPKLVVALKQAEQFGVSDDEENEDGEMAEFMPTTADADAGTIDCVWYGGQAVARQDYNTGDPYMLTLDMAGCRMERLNSGAPIFDSHLSGSDFRSLIAGKVGTRAQLGTVVQAWADGPKGMATLKFDVADPDGAEMFRRASTGIVRNLSFGTWIYRRELDDSTSATGGDDEVSNYTATDWEPFEISPVAVPADFSTQFLSGDQAAGTAKVIGRAIREAVREALNSSASGRENGAQAQKTKEKSDMDEQQLAAARDEAASAAVKAERKRVEDIRAMAAPFKMKEEFVAKLISDGLTLDVARTTVMRVHEIRAIAAPFKLKEDFVTGMIDQGLTVDQAREKVMTELAAAGQKNSKGDAFEIRGEISLGDRDGRETKFSQMQAALLLRYRPNFFMGKKTDHNGNPTGEMLAGCGPEEQRKMEDLAREYRGMSLQEMARESLVLVGKNPRGWDKSRIAAEALAGDGRGASYFGSESTSDFPSILANVLNKTLRQGYESYPRTFQPFSRQVTATDFKPISRVQLSDSPALEKVNEQGEFRRSNLTDSKQNYSLVTLGKIVAITRKVIINDDLQAFTRVPALLGMAAARSESDSVYAVFTGNQVMNEDITALFHANHKNVATGTGSSIDPAVNSTPITAMNSLRKLMRLQKGPQGTPLNLVPRFALAPATLETYLLQLLYPINIASSDSTKVIPEWVRSMVPIIEPRLDAASLVQWYGIADPSQIDTVEYCYLEGQEGVYIETRQGFDIDGVEIKARLDFAAAAIDYRGMARSAGA